MSRFDGLTKIAGGPAARLLAMGNAKIETKLDLPASAEVVTVLEALDAAHAHVDILRLLSVALPPREAVWWACLAGRDLVGEEVKPVPPTLVTAEDWVFKPGDETRQRAREAFDASDSEDPTTLCAGAVSMIDGKLGPGDLAQYDAPPGGWQTMVYGMVLLALGEHGDEFDHWVQVLIERGLDIGRGGNGSIDPATVEPRPAPPDEDDEDEDEDDEDDAPEAGEAPPAAAEKEAD